MRKSKFSEHQIIPILKAVEAGRTVKDSVASMRAAMRLRCTLDSFPVSATRFAKLNCFLPDFPVYSHLVKHSKHDAE